MEYELFAFLDKSKHEIGVLLYNFIKKLVDKPIRFQEYEDYAIDVGCEYFTLTVEVEDISNIPLINKSYDIEANTCISIRTYSDNEILSIEYLLELVAIFMKKVDGDMLLLKNGGTQLIIRKKEQVIVNNMMSTQCLDKYQICYSISDISHEEKAF